MNNQHDNLPAVIPGASCNTKDMAERWNASIADVRGWCRKGCVASAKKVSAKWRISHSAKRPLDRKLVEEILWILLESPRVDPSDIDLSHWGVARTDTAAYLRSMEQDGSIIAGDDGTYSLSKRGFKLLGRGGAKSGTFFEPRSFPSELAVAVVAETVRSVLLS